MKKLALVGVAAFGVWRLRGLIRDGLSELGSALGTDDIYEGPHQSDD